MAKGKDKDRDATPFARCYAFMAHKAERRISALYDAALAPAGLTIRQFAVLNSANASPPLSMARLARRLSADPTTVTRALKPLQERGLVQLDPDPDDARLRLVVITAEGRAAIEEAAPLWRATQKRVEALLGAEAGRLAETLTRTAQLLREV
jgi:DNA-binding MarR family transcriptional regulator